MVAIFPEGNRCGILRAEIPTKKEPLVQHLPYEPPNALSSFEDHATYRAVLKAVKGVVTPPARVLDIGSGRGELLGMFTKAGYDAEGIDGDEACVSLSRRHAPTNLLAVENLSTLAGSYDCAVASHVLEHLRDPGAALREMARLSPFVVVAVPNPLYSPFVAAALLGKDGPAVNATHLYSWDRGHLGRLLSNSGLEAVSWHRDSVALPALTRTRLPLAKAGFLGVVEEKLLRRVFPRLCRSLIVVARGR